MRTTKLCQQGAITKTDYEDQTTCAEAQDFKCCQAAPPLGSSAIVRRLASVKLRPEGRDATTRRLRVSVAAGGIMEYAR